MAGGEIAPLEEPLSPAARLFHAPRFNCFIIAIIGCKTMINVDIVKAGLETTLLKHPRFSSLMVVPEGKKCGQRWVRTNVNLEDHIIIPDPDPDLDAPDQFLEDYISDLTRTSMDLTKPLWELHLINIKTSDANSVGIFKIHHSIGDGVSLMSLVLACTRQTSDPEALPTLPTNRRVGLIHDALFWRILFTIWWVIRVIWNTFVDLTMCVATIWFLKDTHTPIKGEQGVEHNPKRIIHRTVSLDDIKLVKDAMNMTINDVVLGVTQAGLSRYLNRRYRKDDENEETTDNTDNLPKFIRLRTTILVNIRPSAGIEGLAEMMEKGSKVRWGNCIGYILLPFNISICKDPLDYLHHAKSTIDRKKQSLEAVCTFSFANLIIKLFGVKVAAAISHKVLFNTTMAFSNVVGPVEEISFYGHPLSYLAPSVCGHPHALTIHFQSYNNKMTIVLTVDQSVISDPHKLCNDLEESLKLIKNVVLEKRLTSTVVS